MKMKIYYTSKVEASAIQAPTAEAIALTKGLPFSSIAISTTCAMTIATEWRCIVLVGHNEERHRIKESSFERFMSGAFGETPT